MVDNLERYMYYSDEKGMPDDAASRLVVADSLESIAGAIRRLGNADAATPMGGLEALGKAILEGMEPHPARSTQIYFQCAGGAISRVPTDATAFAHRYAKHDMFGGVSWPTGEPRDEHVK